MIYDLTYIKEVAEPVAKAEKEQMAASVMDMEEDLAALFGVDDDFEDDDFSDDDSKGVKKEEPPSVYEVGGPSTMDAKGPSFSLPAPGLPILPSVIKDLSTHLGNLEYVHRQLVQKVIQVSDAEVAATVSIMEIGPRVFVVEGQVEEGQQTMAQRDETIAELTQQVHALQAAVQQRDMQIQ
nr:hypothetical protein [Tanacetum cinerariifolium]